VPSRSLHRNSPADQHHLHRLVLFLRCLIGDRTSTQYCASTSTQPSGDEHRGICPVRLCLQKRWLAVFLSVSFVLTFVVTSRKYIWLYLTRTRDPKPQVVDLLRDVETSKNPEMLLAEANRLACFSIGPRLSLSISAQSSFSKRKATRATKCIHKWVQFGRNRKPCSWVDVSQILGKKVGPSDCEARPKHYGCGASRQRVIRTWRSIRHRRSACGRKLKESP